MWKTEVIARGRSVSEMEALTCLETGLGSPGFTGCHRREERKGWTGILCLSSMSSLQHVDVSHVRATWSQAHLPLPTFIGFMGWSRSLWGTLSPLDLEQRDASAWVMPQPCLRLCVMVALGGLTLEEEAFWTRSHRPLSESIQAVITGWLENEKTLISHSCLLKSKHLFLTVLEADAVGRACFLVHRGLSSLRVPAWQKGVPLKRALIPTS